MAKNFFKIDRGSRFNPQTSAPSSPEAGDFYFDDTLNVHRGYTGSAWVNLGSGSGGGTADALETASISTGSVTVVGTKRRWESGFTIDTGHAWVVDAGGVLVIEDSLVIDGSLTVNGAVRYI